MQMSSAKSRSSGLCIVSHRIPLGLLNAALVTQSKTTKNSRGDSKQPCLTPVVTPNGSVMDYPASEIVVEKLNHSDEFLW